jgi:hypothetical protein
LIVRKIAKLIAIICVLVITYKIIFPSVTLRYRLTIMAELDGQPKNGSGVIQVSYAKNPQILGASAQMLTEVEGDAVYVELGQREALLALLKPGPSNARSAPDYVLPKLFGVAKEGFGPEAFGRIAVIEGRREAPLELLPLMVRFANTADPKSATLFRPPGGQSPNQNLVLKRATIEIVPAGIWPLNLIGITGTPITRGIGTRLPWLKGFKGYSGGQFEPIWTRPEENLVGTDFSMGSSR